jgi:hypothetical protein
MRGIGSRIAILLGAVALWCAAWGLVRSSGRADANALIAPALPQAEGRSVCLTNSFTGRQMDVEDWSQAKLEPTERLSPDGKPYMRPVPPVLKPGQFAPSSLSSSTTTAGPTMTGECASGHAHDKVYGPDREMITANTVFLGCYIDCDGGGFGLDRVA